MRRLSAVVLCATLWVACEDSPASGTPPPPPFTQTFPDGGTPDAGPQEPSACQRDTVVHGAPMSLLSELQLEMSRATTGEARVAAIDRFVALVAEQGGAPLVNDASSIRPRVAFFVRGDAGRDTFVAGAFNEWSATATPLVQVRDTDLYVAEVDIPRTGPQPYKLVKAGNYFQDPAAHHVVWDGLNRNDVGQFNSLVYPGLQDKTKGRLTAWYGVHATALDDARDVFVYTPAAYDGPDCPSLPVMYFHDGNESLTRESFAEAADGWYAAHPGDSAVLVFVALPNQNVRLAQYTFPPKKDPNWPTPLGNEYLGFLRDDLMPRVEAAFRVKTGPQDTGISGASLGGLISVYAGFQMPERFGFVGCQSGSLFWPHDGQIDRDDGNAMVVRAGQDPVVALRFYVDHGSPTAGCTRDGEEGGDDCQSSLQFVAALKGKGYTVAHWNEPGAAHDWSFWKKRLPKLLCSFRNADPKVCGL
ncbi:alpha/beta hydrolase [Pyxidicoccus sp. MSG2]|uniref:alpha/beta hydrolase n=1 Tax=Pyxidicoccus sp. MSG2 TaxID=2996790 RepID=UPI0022717ABB|nr:alpha/beta hydrolase-fold protein [Pyxidicoccus sp. MSG2]MCY1017037.1 alpha/beta hydrolase-fold protein [Pyxidicoccus sp. MSG2]